MPPSGSRHPGRRRGCRAHVGPKTRNFVTVAPREEEGCHRQVRNVQGGGEDVRAGVVRGPLGRLLTECRSAFVSCLIGNALDLGMVQSKIAEFAMRKCAQFAQGVAVNLATGGLGAVFCDQGVHPIHEAAANCANAVCFVSHVSALFEFVCFRSLETKIGECCSCTIEICFNAAMQQLHRPHGSNLCVLR